MAKKDNKTGAAPQKNAGAPATTEPKAAIVENPDETAGATTGDGTDTPGATSQTDGNPAGAGAGDGAGTTTGATEHPNPGRAASDAAETETASGNAAVNVADTKKGAEPKVSDAVVKIGKALLKSNSDMAVVYMTADGSGFYAKNDAELHARTLNNKAVTPVKK